MSDVERSGPSAMINSDALLNAPEVGPIQALDGTAQATEMDREAVSEMLQEKQVRLEPLLTSRASEAVISEIWKEILGAAVVGRHEHLFEDLGGNVEFAVRIIDRLQTTFGPGLSVDDLVAFPTVAAFAAAVSSRDIPQAPDIKPASRDTGVELSPMQQRIWLLQQLDPQACTAFHTMVDMRLRGELDRDAFRTAIHALVERHEALRLRFVLQDSQLLQFIGPADSAMRLVEENLSDLSTSEKERLIKARQIEDAGSPFDLATGPLLRIRLLQLSDTDHVLLLVQHGIVSDHRSITIFMRELSALYRAYRHRDCNPLVPLTLQYPDFVAWQRREEGVAHDQSMAFWKRYLADVPPLLELPADHLRPPIPTYRGGHVPFSIEDELVVRLRRLSQRHETTLFVTMLTAWTALLARLSGQHDVLVVTTVSSPGRAILEPAIGPFAHTLALRLRLDGKSTVSDSLAHVKASVFDAYAHRDVSFDDVAEELHLRQEPGHAPVAQIGMLMNETLRAQDFNADGLVVCDLEVVEAAAQYDLALKLDTADDAITCRLLYATDLFDQTTIERMAGHFVTLLRGMVTDHTQPIERLPLLSDSERHEILVGFNQTAVPFPGNSLIQQEFEAWVLRRPDTVAVTFEGDSLTYAQLNERANRLAHYLIRLGVCPDDRVAICVERGVDVVIGLLGILKAGGSYLPLDPKIPAERLRLVLTDSTPAVLVTQTALRDRVPDPSLRAVILDRREDRMILDQQPSSNPNPAELGVTSRHLAYTIYTSGSTGTPKGVMVEHRSVLRLAIDNDCTPIAADDCVAHCANLAFDISTWEIWGTLLNGARLVIFAAPVMLNPQEMVAQLRQYKVNKLCLAVGLFNEYAEADEAAFADLEYLSVGGDALDPQSVSKIVSSPHAPRRFANSYGPTEATTWATNYIVRSVASDARSVPIGRPIANTQAYIVDHLDKPVPIGVVGEILIGGPGVARGYLNRPELTQERFIPDQFGTEPGEQLYRTGDLGRWLPDGNIEFLGRNDNQVKVRGFRIELGEIEVRLAGCTGVREAVVVARQHQAAGKQLIAYMTAQPGHDLMPDDLRSQLLRVLPDYMVPSAFITVPSFPLTANGKLDRRALPLPPEKASEQGISYKPPRGPLENALAEIWRLLFGIDRVGRNDHFFFDLGGNSLLAVRMVTQISRRLGVALPLAALFRAPTIGTLAVLLADGSTAGEGRPLYAGPSDWSPLVEIKAGNAKPPLFCIHGAGGNVLIFSQLVRMLGSDRPIFGLEARGTDGILPPFPSFNAMVEAHLAAIHRAWPDGPYYLLGYSGGGAIAFEIAQRLKAEGKQIALLSMLDTGCPTVFGRWVPLHLRISRARASGQFAAMLGDLMPHKLFERRYQKFCYWAARLIASRGIVVPLHLRDPFLAVSFGKVFHQYKPQRYDGSILLFSSGAANAIWTSDPGLGWSEFASNGVEVLQVGGGHEEMMRAPFIQKIAERLRAALADPQNAERVAPTKTAAAEKRVG